MRKIQSRHISTRMSYRSVKSIHHDLGHHLNLVWSEVDLVDGLGEAEPDT